MATKQKSELRLLGKVSTAILEDIFHGEDMNIPNTLWLFVDYSESTYPLETIFDFIILPDGKHWVDTHKLKLLRVANQYSNKLPEISEGYKTICLFEFDPDVPSVIKKLPTRKTWKSSDKQLSLRRRQDINLRQLVSADSELIQSTASFVISEMRKIRERHPDAVFGIEQIARLARIRARRRLMGRFLVDNLITMGKLKEKKDNKFEPV